MNECVCTFAHLPPICFARASGDDGLLPFEPNLPKKRLWQRRKTTRHMSESQVGPTLSCFFVILTSPRKAPREKPRDLSEMLGEGRALHSASHVAVFGLDGVLDWDEDLLTIGSFGAQGGNSFQAWRLGAA